MFDSGVLLFQEAEFSFLVCGFAGKRNDTETVTILNNRRLLYPSGKMMLVHSD
jgi:hypothetical protein